jgi:hypothetical protein
LSHCLVDKKVPQDKIDALNAADSAGNYPDAVPLFVRFGLTFRLLRTASDCPSADDHIPVIGRGDVMSAYHHKAEV